MSDVKTAAIVIASVVLGFVMGMTTQTFAHREQMAAYDLLKQQSMVERINEQTKQIERKSKWNKTTKE